MEMGRIVVTPFKSLLKCYLIEALPERPVSCGNAASPALQIPCPALFFSNTSHILTCYIISLYHLFMYHLSIHHYLSLMYLSIIIIICITSISLSIIIYLSVYLFIFVCPTLTPNASATEQGSLPILFIVSPAPRTVPGT